ncbi:hypothetical protein BDW42DRAFT_81459 [Aspergillus taichungensis]|uniref:Uncharacterized protein n=1 Tax=Aspergillus taichungensis TaxID=482145 RepID=A0A2J5HXT8_9EURO|nr:hypothetical protein BDW42DRAFT_81459 [Aspergillus taichungensis]
MTISILISQSSGPIDPDNKVTWEHLEDVSTSISQSSELIDNDNKITWEHWEHLEDVSTPIFQSSGQIDTGNNITWGHLENMTSLPTPPSSNPVTPNNEEFTWGHLENMPSLPTPLRSNPVTPNNEEITWGHRGDTSAPTSLYSGPTDPDNEITWEHLEHASCCSSLYEEDDKAVMDKLVSASSASNNPEPVSNREIMQEMPLKALFLHVVAFSILCLLWLLLLIKMLRRELHLLEQNCLI